MTLHAASFAELDAWTLYALLRLRTAVFVVEQQCAYADLDGRDTEPGTRHLWITPDGGDSDPQAYLRLLSEPDGTIRIGRVCTAPKARGTGLSGRLVAAALDLVGNQTPCVLDAQSYLVRFYARYGFVATGPEFIEDGIPHTPMRRTLRCAEPSDAPNLAPPHPTPVDLGRSQLTPVARSTQGGPRSR